MKRALAERAKQSGIPIGVSTPSVPSMQEMSPSLDAPSLEAPTQPLLQPTIHNQDINGTAFAPQMHAKEEPPRAPSLLQDHNLTKIVISEQEDGENRTLVSATETTTQSKLVPSPRPSPSPRPKKRLRDSSTEKFKQLQEEDEDDSSASAFYLKHQNRALSSELRSVKYQLSRLERERDYRRTQCSEALKSINSLNSIWRQLESSLGQGGDAQSSGDAASISFATPPLSTGSGTSVELIGAFVNSLARLGDTSSSKIRGEVDMGEEKKIIAKDEDEMDTEEDPTLNATEGTAGWNDLSQITENIAKRASTLQSAIWSLLQKFSKTPALNGEVVLPPSNAELRDKIILLESENASLQQQIEEIARSRDEVTESDRRVRRGLYRLAAGRVQLKEVLKAVASADEDKEAAAAWMEAGPMPTPGLPLKKSASMASVVNSAGENANPEDGKESAIASEEVAQLKKQVAELNEVAVARDEQIKQLLSEREEQLKRINTLVLEENETSEKVLSPEEVRQSDLFLQLSAELAAKERKLLEFEEKTKQIKEEWSKALANSELSKQAMEDLQSKHLKRWAELAQENPDIGPAEEGGEIVGTTKAEEIVTLQHKLTQALENVRQAVSTRKTLDEAIAMNDSLQAKVDEFKSKYTALQAEKAARAANAPDTTESNGTSGSNNSTKEKSGDHTSSSNQSSEKSDRSSDKLHRDYKRARKELAAATASKEAAKAKLERMEKEKDFLNQMNARLLKQSAEKDEINAKSLSTILHLKQLTEQISKERDNLEQQVKSAEQLALAARLASNARERVAEEFEKERKALEDQVKDWERKCNDLAQEKALAEGKLSQEKLKMSKVIADAQKAKERCEELASESTKLQEEKQKMIESLALAQREASEASILSQRLAESQGGGLVSGFTAEQLNTQVTVLKNRLACPVCNVRDKKCILLRCRHMFCKQCVDENVKNRSRKCPACGGRFDTKDVADVWL
ncbi:zinc finger C3HC4 type domain containing protein [Nitzschia inconspicua]|uniref:E3 ubiquitin protein ligase n=1 Tax=Nitzschia inconspicua TaxID=303405 RepID=A0A9K3LRM4_9STRA|nr:zinc finger C3HC4 type domain containing protein [Nitzschia inconspicua]